MRVAVNSHALPVYKKNRIAALLCIFETTKRRDGISQNNDVLFGVQTVFKTVLKLNFALNSF